VFQIQFPSSSSQESPSKNSFRTLFVRTVDARVDECARASQPVEVLSSHRTKQAVKHSSSGLRHKVAALSRAACESGVLQHQVLSVPLLLPGIVPVMRAVPARAASVPWQRFALVTSGSHGPRSARIMSHSMPSNTQGGAPSRFARDDQWRRAKRAPKPEGRTKIASW